MNLKKVGYGIVIFFLATFFILISMPIVTEIMTAVNAGENAIGDTVEGIIWIGVILLWIIFTLVLPGYFFWEGSREADNIPNFLKITTGVLVFFFSITITYFTRFMITGIVDAFTDNVSVTFFWVALIINWIMITIVVPAFIIMDGTKQ